MGDCKRPYFLPDLGDNQKLSGVPNSPLYLNSELWKGEDPPLSYDLYKKSRFTLDTKICTSQCHLNYLPFFHTSQCEELNGFKEKSTMW